MEELKLSFAAQPACLPATVAIVAATAGGVSPYVGRANRTHRDCPAGCRRRRFETARARGCTKLNGGQSGRPYVGPFVRRQSVRCFRAFCFSFSSLSLCTVHYFSWTELPGRRAFFSLFLFS